MKLASILGIRGARDKPKDSYGYQNKTLKMRASLAKR